MSDNSYTDLTLAEVADKLLDEALGLQTELTGVTGVPLSEEWQPIAIVPWPNAPEELLIAICWKLEPKG